MNSELSFNVRVNVGILFIGDEYSIITAEGDINIDDINGILEQLIAEREGW